MEKIIIKSRELMENTLGKSLWTNTLGFIILSIGKFLITFSYFYFRQTVTVKRRTVNIVNLTNCYKITLSIKLNQ